MWPTQAEPERKNLTIEPSSIVDLSTKVTPDGVLTWEVPPGDWTIVRSGMAPTGVQNGPASPEGAG